MHSITIVPADELVEATLDGVIDFAERLATFKEIVDAIETSGASRLLINYAPGARVAIERFEYSNVMASSLAHDPTLVGCRIAYVTPDLVRVDPVTETLAYARGFSGQRFRSRDDALRWLLEA
jgi:hypothetical protein